MKVMTPDHKKNSPQKNVKGDDDMIKYNHKTYKPTIEHPHLRILLLAFFWGGTMKHASMFASCFVFLFVLFAEFTWEVEDFAGKVKHVNVVMEQNKAGKTSRLLWRVLLVHFGKWKQKIMRFAFNEDFCFAFGPL